tara:strand:+ start:471 stop:671 length:201 start_codon:yes stop_codon:yes gene_type:complete
LKACLPYLVSKELSTLSDIAEDVPLFIDDAPVVIAFSDSKQREEYENASDERKAEMEKELRVDVWS